MAMRMKPLNKKIELDEERKETFKTVVSSGVQNSPLHAGGIK
jgi:hypothetical protein